MEAPSPSIHIPADWSEAADFIASDSIGCLAPVSIICGPKNSGKTTFSRYLLNTLLLRYKRVAYLDTDVGQPEFTAPGCLSLTVIEKITPDFTIPCLKTPERCYFFGDVSSKRDPELYKKCVWRLYDYYNKEYRSNENGNPNRSELPLIINTPGWVKGIGYDILVDMLNYIPSTHVVKISTGAESKNLPTGSFWLDSQDSDSFSLIEIRSALWDSCNRSVLVQKESHLLRDRRLIAYFRQCLANDLDIDTIRELANALASHPPYQISVSSIQIKHLHCQVPCSEVLYSANASVVGLAVSSKEDNCLPICVGLGIIRGIDTYKNMMYVITPVLPSILENVDLLLLGFIQLPTGLLQVQGCRSPYMSANVLPTKAGAQDFKRVAFGKSQTEFITLKTKWVPRKPSKIKPDITKCESSLLVKNWKIRIL
ncbi:hypothetical protein V2J09_001364 [Rumex salicifolius]